MAQQTINVGASPNDGTGTPLRTAFQYTNSNFTELYTAVGPSGNNIVVPGSATISGDLTVRTNKLAVTSNGVGIGTATPAAGFALDIQTAAGTAARIKGGSGSGQGSAYYVTLAASTSTLMAIGDRANIFGGTPDTTASIYTGSGIPLTFDVGGSTAMTLNATGLGVGAGPGLTGSSRRALTVNAPTGQLSILELAVNSVTTGYLFSNATQTSLVSQGATFLTFDTNSNERMRIDNAGNVGIGVTPTNKLTIGTGSFNSNTASGSASLYATVSQGLVAIADGFVFGTRAGVKRLDVDTSGNIISNLTSTAPTLSDNGFMVFNLTSNTNLMISVRGTDGVTRTANLTLA